MPNSIIFDSAQNMVHKWTTKSTKQTISHSTPSKRSIKVSIQSGYHCQTLPRYFIQFKHQNDQVSLNNNLEATSIPPLSQNIVCTFKLFIPPERYFTLAQNACKHKVSCIKLNRSQSILN